MYVGSVIMSGTSLVTRMRSTKMYSENKQYYLSVSPSAVQLYLSAADASRVYKSFIKHGFSATLYSDGIHSEFFNVGENMEIAYIEFSNTVDRVKLRRVLRELFK